VSLFGSLKDLPCRIYIPGDFGLGPKHSRLAENYGQEIVEVVRDPSCGMADCLHFLCVNQLCVQITTAIHLRSEVKQYLFQRVGPIRGQLSPTHGRIPQKTRPVRLGNSAAEFTPHSSGPRYRDKGSADPIVSDVDPLYSNSVRADYSP
jgi:hypothetical protein